MYLILDIGGTHTRIGLVNDAFKLLETSYMLTDKKYENGMKNILHYIKSKDIRVTNVCMGIAGVINNGKLHYSPNLKDWVGKPIKKDLEKEIGAKVFLENDAAMAGLGEAVYGAGKNHEIVSYFTISTGVGGARIVNKNIDEKVCGFEPGKQIINTNLSLSSSLRTSLRKNAHVIARSESTKQFSNLSTFESLVSGEAIKKEYGQLPEKVTDISVWKEIIKTIALGIANSCYFWSPEAIILGGGVTHSDYFDLKLLKTEVSKILIKTYPKSPDIKKSALGDFSGIWGGIAYLKNSS